MSDRNPNNQPVENPSPARWDWITPAIWLFFIALSLMMLGCMWEGYRISSHTAAANRLYEQDQYEKAIVHLRAIVTRFPSAWVRQRQLGDCYLETGQPKQALDCYQAALAVNPEADLSEELGMAWSEIGDPDRARTYFQKVLSVKPHSPAINYYLGVQSFDAGRYHEAAQRFQAAAGDRRWDRRADEYRQRLSKIVLDGQETPEPPAEYPEG